jgi:hypothetical protein
MSGRAGQLGRRVFRALTSVLFVACLWTIYANVLSDDTAVRAQAGELVRTTAGCGDKCKVVGMEGERGMISEIITFTIEGKGQYVATCRRPFVLAGDYACTAAKP